MALLLETMYTRLHELERDFSLQVRENNKENMQVGNVH